jgi:hypothetical protein
MKTPCNARMLTKGPQPPSSTMESTTSSPVVISSKLNKYSCGYDWKDTQQRCEVWCPSGSNDDCSEDQLCMAFTECHTMEMNALTLKQIEEATAAAEAASVTAPATSGAADVADASATVDGAGDGGRSAAPAAAGGGNGNDDLWWEPETGGGGSGSSGGGDGVTPKPTKRQMNKLSMSAEEAVHRYSFCGAFWDDARDNCETKTRCADDCDCPEFEFFWTQTRCDNYATEMPKTYPPLGSSIEETSDP